MKKLTTRLLLLGLILLAASSCSLIPKPSAVHDLGYLYANTPSLTTSLPQHSPVTITAPKWLTDNRIHYRLLYATPTQVRFYALDRWIAPPPELFEQLFNNSDKHWPMPITIQLQVFEQQFDAPNQAKVVIRFTATTVPDDNHQKPNQLDFQLQLPCPTPDAKGAVMAFNQMAKQAVDKVQAWLDIGFGKK